MGPRPQAHTGSQTPGTCQPVTVYCFPHQELFCPFLGGSRAPLTNACLWFTLSMIYFSIFQFIYLTFLRTSGCQSEFSTRVYVENTLEAKWVILVAATPKCRGENSTFNIRTCSLRGMSWCYGGSTALRANSQLKCQ